MIVDDAIEQVPNEACGLIAGDGKTIQRAYPLSNIASKRVSRYALEPNEQLHALKSIDAENLTWMGVYHSHPNSAAIPSTADINEAGDHGLLQLIVSLKKSKPELQLWRVKESGAMPLKLIFDTQSDSDTGESALSKQQRAAIIVAGVLSLILLLAISFTLLPPAPKLAAIP